MLMAVSILDEVPVIRWSTDANDIALPETTLVYVPSEQVFVLTGDVGLFEKTFENVSESVSSHWHRTKSQLLRICVKQTFTFEAA